MGTRANADAAKLKEVLCNWCGEDATGDVYRNSDVYRALDDVGVTGLSGLLSLRPRVYNFLRKVISKDLSGSNLANSKFAAVSFTS